MTRPADKPTPTPIATRRGTRAASTREPDKAVRVSDNRARTDVSSVGRTHAIAGSEIAACVRSDVGSCAVSAGDSGRDAGESSELVEATEDRELRRKIDRSVLCSRSLITYGSRPGTASPGGGSERATPRFIRPEDPPIARARSDETVGAA